MSKPAVCVKSANCFETLFNGDLSIIMSVRIVVWAMLRPPSLPRRTVLRQKQLSHSTWYIARVHVSMPYHGHILLRIALQNGFMQGESIRISGSAQHD